MSPDSQFSRIDHSQNQSACGQTPLSELPILESEVPKAVYSSHSTNTDQDDPPPTDGLIPKDIPDQANISAAASRSICEMSRDVGDRRQSEKCSLHNVERFPSSINGTLDSRCEAVAAALIQSEERYRRLLELSFEAIVIHSAGKVVYINPAGALLFGAESPQQLEGRQVLDFVHPDYHELIREQGFNLSANRTSDSRIGSSVCSPKMSEGHGVPLIEEKFIRLDGKDIDVEVAAVPITHQGQPAVLAAIRDITARKQMEVELKARARQQAAVAALGQRAIALVGGRTVTLDVLMDEAVQLVAKTLDIEYCTILELLTNDASCASGRLYDSYPTSAQTPEFLVRAGVGWESGVVGHARVPSGTNSMEGYTLRSGAPAIVEDFATETRFQVDAACTERGVVAGISVIIGSGNFEASTPQDHLEISQFGKFASTPLEVYPCSSTTGSKNGCGTESFYVPNPCGAKPFGILSLCTKQRRRFTEDDVHFLVAIANILADAIDRHRELGRRHLLERAIAAANNGILITDPRLPDNPLIYVNPSFERQTGYSAAEIIGRNCRFLQGTDTAQPQLEELRSKLQQGQDVQVILRNYRKDGTLFWNELSISPVFSPTGALEYFVGVQTDITYRIQAEASLRQSHEQIVTILESIADAFFAVDADRRFTYINREAEQLLHRRREELLGKQIWEAFPEAVGSLFYVEYNRAIQEQVAVKFEAFYEPLGRWLAVHAYPAAGGLSVYFNDITERRQSTEALRESEERYRRIVETSTEGVWVLDANGHTSFVNQQLCEMLGYTVEEGGVSPERGFPSPPQSLFEFMDREGGAIARSLLQQRTQGISEKHDFKFRKRDGSELWTIVSANPIFDATGEYAGALGMITDITDRKRAEVALEQQIRGERLMATIQSRIRQSLNPSDILNTTVAEVRQFLTTDRVLIYQFQPDGSGFVAVESVDERWMPILGTVINDVCFSEQFVPLYRNGRVRAIDDLQASGLNQCHIDLLTQFQVKANLVVPILVRSPESGVLRESGVQSPDSGNVELAPQLPSSPAQLWGLLIAHHCSAPRHWLPLEIDLLQQLATQVGIAIQQSELYQQVSLVSVNLEAQVLERTAQLQESLNFAQVVRRITDKVRESLDENQILQTAVEELASVLKVDYCCAALYDAEQTTASISYEHAGANLGSGLGQQILMAEAPTVYAKLCKGEYFESYESGRQQYFQGAELGDLACPDLKQIVAAKLLVPITDFTQDFKGEGGTDSRQQGEIFSSVGGGATPAPLRAIGHLAMLHSQYRVFTQAEIHLVQQVSVQCAIALRQARLYQASQAQVSELEKLNRLKDEFLSTVSHELRTPMANMKMAIQMLKIALRGRGDSAPTTGGRAQPAAPTTDKIHRYLQILHDECEREISLINDLLDLQRLDAGISGELTQMQLTEWLPEVVASFQERAQNRLQRLHLQLEQELPSLITDASSLERVVVELLNNACKYTPPGEEIIVSVAVESGCMQLRVTNFGIEIPASELGHIFEKFYRVPSADPWKQGGTGLGLALVQKLTTHLGGTIQVQSGEGRTCFTVELPLQPTGQ